MYILYEGCFTGKLQSKTGDKISLDVFQTPSKNNRGATIIFTIPENIFHLDQRVYSDFKYVFFYTTPLYLSAV